MKRASRLSALALSLLLLLSALPAALGVEVDPTGLGVGYSAILYDNSNGLPTSEANAIVQSSDGFIWIGSYSGLIRYDGSDFFRYDASSGVSSVVSLLADSVGRLWVGTNDSGAACLEGETFTFYSQEDGLNSSSIRALAEDPAGNILLGTTMGLACVDPEGALRLIRDDMLDKQYICELNPAPDGTIYGVTNSGDMFTVKDCRLTGYYGAGELGMDAVNSVLPDPEKPGWVYLGSGGSEVVYGDLAADLAGAVRLDAGPLRNINAIRSLDGSLWVCADNGIGFFRDGAFTLLRELPMTSSVDRMLRDHEDNLWFSSSRQGIMKIVPCRFTDVSARAGLDSMVVNTTCRSGGNLYVGADNGLTVLDEASRPVTTPLTELLDGVRIRCIRPDRRGRLWICTYNNAFGLVRYDPATGETATYTTANGLAADRARMITELSDGTIAVATNAGMNLIRDDEVAATYDGAQGIGNLEILCIEEGADGTVYLGSDGGGIYVVNGSRVSRLGVEDGLRSEVILRIRKDPFDELYWIITSNSISYLKDGAITTLRTFPYSNNFDLFFDQQENAWVVSSDGIYVAPRADLLADRILEYTHYDADTGMTRMATANSYSQLDPDGTLSLACSTGVLSLNIFEEDAGSSKVRLAVPYLLADDAYVPVGEARTVHIPADCRRLSIYANAFTYALYNPHLSYQLEGFDREAEETTKQDMQPPTYTNLPGGAYRFLLSLLDPLTGRVVDTLSLTIVKDKAFHEQLWFRALSVLTLAVLTGLAVWLILRRKTAALVRKQQETRQLVNEMTHVFAECVDMKDAYTNGHSIRVARYTAMLARKLGKNEQEVADIYNIALLHDIGKISIPDNILNKPGRLTDEEFAVMKSHSSRGYEILKGIQIAPELAVGAGFHHERMDGKGYPRGLAGDEIPEVARIIAVADTFDAMYSTRPYRKKLPLDQVAAEIRRCAGTQLSPRVVEAFLALVDEGAFGPGPEDPPAPGEGGKVAGEA